ncbi:hypothetical protein BSNK01_22760 [Bacillaceae bacterium]
MKVKGRGAKITNKNKKKTRVCPYVPDDLLKKLKKLAFVLDKTPAELGLEIWKICLNNPNFVVSIQQHYNVPEDEFIKPIVDNGKVHY